MGRRAVVIGAGSSGLAAVKEHLENGTEVVCLEKSDVIGGVFSEHRESAYDGLYLTTSNLFMSYSDLPWMTPTMRYSPKEEYAEYLNYYCDTFKLRPYIKLKRTVRSAKKCGDTWTIECVRDEDGEVEIYECECLAVATGANSVPRDIAPIAPGYAGPKMHSLDVQNSEPFAGKHVLVVGTGESATDISSDSSTVAASVTVWSRRPFLVAPRFPEMMINDARHDEYDIITDERRWSTIKIAQFLEYFNTNRLHNMNPLWLWGSLRQGFWESVNQPESRAPPAFRLLASWSQLMWRVISEKDQASLRKKAWYHADQAAFATKNSRIASMCARGKLNVLVAKEALFGESSVVFPEVVFENLAILDPPEERRIDQLDAVICCIGYDTTFPFLDLNELQVELDPRTWFKHCFPPGHGDSLAFLGWARGHQGGIPAMAELLARYHALLVAGHRKLPDNYAQIGLAEGQAESAYYFLSPGLRALVDYPSFADSVAQLIGCEPHMPNPFWSPAMFIKYWAYPLWPCWYRLRGPGRNVQAAYCVLKDRFPLAKLGGVNPFPTAITMILNGVMVVFNTLTRIFRGGTKGNNIGNNYLWNRSKMFILHGNLVKTWV